MTANDICRTLVEGLVEAISDRSPYDIRALGTAEIEPEYWVDYVNSAFVQDALGVDLNYTSPSSIQVFLGFRSTGDWAYNKLHDLEKLLERGVRVALIYGDAVSSAFILQSAPSSRSLRVLTWSTGLPRQLVRRRSNLTRRELLELG